MVKWDEKGAIQRSLTCFVEMRNLSTTSQACPGPARSTRPRGTTQGTRLGAQGASNAASSARVSSSSSFSLQTGSRSCPPRSEKPLVSRCGALPMQLVHCCLTLSFRESSSSSSSQWPVAVRRLLASYGFAARGFLRFVASTRRCVFRVRSREPIVRQCCLTKGSVRYQRLRPAVFRAFSSDALTQVDVLVDCRCAAHLEPRVVRHRLLSSFSFAWESRQRACRRPLFSIWQSQAAA